MHSKRPIIPVIVLLLLAAVAGYWWLFIRTVEPKDMIAASGTIEATTVVVSSEASGKVLKIDVDEGQQVKAGQELAKIEATQLENRLGQAKNDAAIVAETLDKLEEGAEKVDVNVYDIVATSAKIALDDAQKSYNDVVAATDKDLVVSQTTVENTLRTRNFTLDERQEALADYEELVKKYEHPDWHIPNYTKSEETEVDAAKAVADTAYNTFLTAENAYKAALESKAQAQKKADQARNTAQVAVDSASGNYQKALAQLKQAKKPARRQDLQAARNSLDSAQKRIDSVLTDIDKTTVKAPLTGVVLTKAIETGELATAGKTLFEIGDLSKVKLAIYVPEAKLGLIRLGQPAKIQVDSYPDRSWEGKITKISDKAEFTPTNIQTKEQRVTTVFEVTIEIANADQSLKPGMPADATIKLTTK